MAEVILMPRLSDTMTEGVIANWHKSIGDTVKKGDVLADIETDKATMELESYKEGILLFVGAKKNEKILVNDLLAIIGSKDEDISQLIQPITPPPIITDTNTTKKTELTTVVQSNHTAPISHNDAIVLMPRLSDTMTEGIIANWYKDIGDNVKKGDVLADIETDKATMELESYKNGFLLHKGANKGEKINVNDLLCIIGEKDLDIQSLILQAKNKNTSTANETSSTAQNNSSTHTTPQVASNHQERIFISPLAKKIANEKGVDIRTLQGSGDNGRIIKVDVERNTTLKKDIQVPIIASATKVTAPLSNTPATLEAKYSNLNNPINKSDTDEVIPISQMRKTIARRLSESKFTSPHFYLTIEVNMDTCVEVRTKINLNIKEKITFNDIIIKAVAHSLQLHPKINSSWTNESIIMHKQINVGVAVAMDEGLFVPVIRNANQLSLSEINKQVKDLAIKAKDKKLQPSDWEGNTFTISNLGMFGIESFTAIINPPDACILSVGAIIKKPIVKDDAIVIGNTMKLCLSCDHRIVDGSIGSAFLQTLKYKLEDPIRMLV